MNLILPGYEGYNFRIQTPPNPHMGMQSAWTQAGETLTAISKKCETLSKSLTKAGRTMTRTITTPILGLGTAAVKASIDYEYAFADVRKTVDATEEEYEKLSDRKRI